MLQQIEEPLRLETHHDHVSSSKGCGGGVGFSPIIAAPNKA